ncbi:uncharacterized protein PGTG_12554 [Puccinia graminis f. sp. tritici CRL 75-36-700-3]|uniref:Uncharacterized protein n=1 Tax=Puccinia graminis f. sp. tritici (strain CRL 75-36-700-3 / race SCCL) TaxID=418459 RepID=E3KV07_PUCGT|nr:uncharacterized protein PGTG_12554 [Puccinia graminis f. sp. tritici CRL 75-36-700-3]EFP88107.2 hypothetical protein PGTG_12554 [Puccinia graminis f. sp. tritici CRL 75-36-700-3]
MTTRSNTNPDKLFPLTDPDAIIRSGNAEQRGLKQLKSNPTAPLPLLSKTTPPTAMSGEIAPAHERPGRLAQQTPQTCRQLKTGSSLSSRFNMCSSLKHRPTIDKLQRIAEKLRRIAALTDVELLFGGNRG